MRSSDNITLFQTTADDPHLGNLWGGIFYHPVFVNAAAYALGLDGQSNIVCIDGQPAGVIDLLHKKRLGIRTLLTPMLFQYNGPLVFNSEKRESYFELMAAYLASRFDFVYTSLSPQMGAEPRSQWNCRPAITLAVQADRLKNWGSDFRDDVKNKINKAKKAGVKISIIDTMPEELWKITFTRQGIAPPIDPSSLATWCRILIDNSLMRIFAADIDGRLVAFRGELIFGNYAYDWIAGSDPAYHSSGANQLLMAEIGQELSTIGPETWDLVGGDIKSIADFKKSFGAIEIPHLHIYRAVNFRGRIFNIIRRIKHGRE